MSMKLIDNILSNLSVRILSSLLVSKPSHWRETKAKSDYTLWNITDGDLTIIINGNIFHATKGDVVLFYPQTKYTAYTDKNGCKFLFNYFKLETGNNIDLLSGANFSGIMQGACLTFCKKFLKEYKTAHASLRLYSLFLNHLSKIMYATNSNNYTLFYKESKLSYNSTIAQTLEYLNEHYCEDISIKLLAKNARLSEKHFIAAFKKSAGIPPHAYIVKCRMRKAATLITDTSLKMDEIAHKLGYADRYTFSKAFKKFYSETPINFRKSM